MQKYTNFIASTTASNSTLVVLSNASCVVYIAGTLGAATLYSDNGVTPLANPFLSSATGRIDFYAANGRYDVVVSKVGFLSVTISDIELDDLLAPSGSNSVGYLPAGTGAVATTVQTKLREGLSVKDFGATGNGVTDDTVAIQLAFTSAAALTPKKTVYFPAGTYVINPSTIIDATGCNIDGEGQSVSIIKPSALAQPDVNALFVHLRYVSDSNFTVSNIQIDLTNVTYAGVHPSTQRSSHLLVFNCTNWSVRNCSFTGISNNHIGMYPNGGNYWEVTDCYFQNLVPSIQYSQAINIQANSGTHRVLNNVMNGTGLFSNSADGLVSNNVAYNISFGAGLAFGPAIGCENNVITNNHLTGGFGSPDVNNTYTAGIENWGANSVITGNYCADNSGSGIAHGGPNGVIANNICLNNGQGGSLLSGITAYSILAPIVTGPSNSVITGNLCSDTQAVKTQIYGYRESGAGVFTGMMVHSNYFYGNLTGDQLLFQTLPQVLRSNSPAWMPSMSVGSATPATNVNLLSNSFQSLTGVDASALRVIDSFASTATSGNRGINFQMSTAAAVTNVTPVFINNTTTTGAGAITNQTGIFIQDLTTGTNIKAIQTNVAAGANKYNIFVSGTAPNYFAGEVQIAGGATPILHSITAQNNGAGAAVGTVTNAPAAGNPTKWIAFDDAGVTRYIPAW